MNIDSLVQGEANSYELRQWTGQLGPADGKEEVTLYSRPLSPADVAAVRRKFPDFMTQPEPAAMVDIICRKAVDEDENKVFILSKHGVHMRNWKASLIAEIFSALFADDFDEDHDFEKQVGNSETTKTD
jgi:hypothetical protein